MNTVHVALTHSLFSCAPQTKFKPMFNNKSKMVRKGSPRPPGPPRTRQPSPTFQPVHVAGDTLQGHLARAVRGNAARGAGQGRERVSARGHRKAGAMSLLGYVWRNEYSSRVPRYSVIRVPRTGTVLHTVHTAPVWCCPGLVRVVVCPRTTSRALTAARCQQC